MSGWSTSYNRGKIFDPQKACVRLCKSQTIGLDFFHQSFTFNLHELTTIIVTTLSATVHDDRVCTLTSNPSSVVINNMSAKKRRRDTRSPQASRPADGESFTDFKCLVCLQLLIEPVCRHCHHSLDPPTLEVWSYRLIPLIGLCIFIKICSYDAFRGANV